LGAGLNNGKPSKTLARRINTGAAYLKQDTALHAVVCGGRGFLEEVTEAQVMADLLQQSGIAAHRIMMEDSSKNTYENLLYSQKFVDINAKIVIVTSEFHLFRAKRIAKKAGYKNIGGIASKTPLLLLPTCYAREYFAVVKALIFSDI
jgi:uncharacterized SAM-binding protein YcdF (DUF218 family)